MRATKKAHQFEVIGATVTGASHLRQNLPNQDALLLMPVSKDKAFRKRNTPLVNWMCAADGHGSKRCFRSHIGSRLAVEALSESVTANAPEVLKGLDQIQNSIATAPITTVGQAPIPELRTAAEQALKVWVQKVLTHLRENPFKIEEVDGLDDKSRRALGSNALLAYGATLVGVFLLGDYYIGFNLGDGDLCMYSQEGVFNFKYSDENTIADHTYSLCTSGALAYWQYVAGSIHTVDALMIATDGYRNSYKTAAGFEQVGRDLMAIHRHSGVSAIEKDWNQWLVETTQYGSGDDITAAIALRSLGKKGKKRLWR